jgi:pantoate kinase
MPRGGKLGNKGGRKKGYKEKQTLEKEEARRIVRELVFASLQPMVSAQIANSIGTKYMVKREKSGKFVRLTQEALEALLEQGGEEIIQVYDKDPNVAAFVGLMDRAIDRPKESLDAEVNLTGSEALLLAIREGMKRARG